MQKEYQLIIKGDTFNTRSKKIYPYIEIYSVSSKEKNYIIYDSNPFFSPLALTDAINRSDLDVQYEIFAFNQLDFNAEYQVFIDIMNSVSHDQGTRYEIDFTNGESSAFQMKSEIPLLPNQDYFMKNTYYTAVTSQPQFGTDKNIYNPISDSQNGFLGINPEDTKDTKQKLVFLMNIQNIENKITSTKIVIDNTQIPPVIYETIPNNAGFYLIANKNVIEFENSSNMEICQQAISSLKVGEGLISNAVIQQNEYLNQNLGQFTRLKISTSKRSDLDNMFTNDKIFGVKNVFVRRHSSLYADDNILDFYFYFYDQIDSHEPKLMSAFLFNGYTINSPKPFNLRYSTVNWYGGSGITNQGQNIPTFIRLGGYLTKVEKRQGNQRIVIFFTGLDFFYDNNSDTSFEISCSSSVGQVDTKCRGFSNYQQANDKYPQQNYLNMRRIEVEFPEEVPEGSVNSFEFPRKFQILHYGNDAPTSPVNNNMFSVRIESSITFNIIDQTDSSLGFPGVVSYENLATLPQIIILQAMISRIRQYHKMQKIIFCINFGQK
ncbi:hypothetical protein IMG5_137280 [Ichthyophthirius multifiliis]|uniref:Uncharacterized protein n=1 Tax=Ichthyophthirius multifiliis TaxID=5932 RepID=G0QX21_ICHMU|nr:hypothetical protein IMG5_137280 [Ichthyophthirius multifiliis]EGR30232.1 hypothetical protein IMG5_137280 [Ichthyophthirius multifiliis]|eukprot:XP_004031828.1 hypothetical protein IMG5_137280 [Ichthyophthirius multifiliis]